MSEKEVSGMDMSFETIFAAHRGADHTRALLDEQDWTLDWDNQPSTYKRYPGSERIELPRDFPAPMLTLFEAAAGARRFATPRAIDLPMLAQWLWCAYGISATKTYGEGKILYRRTAPSGGALYPAEVYFFANHVDGLAPGFYHFDVSSFAIERIGGTEVFHAVTRNVDHPALDGAPLVAALSAIWWRNAWKYRWRNFRYCNQDLGHVVGNMLTAAECMELEPTAIYSFADEPINRAMGFESPTECVLSIVPVRIARETGAGTNGLPRPHTVPRMITLDKLPGRGETRIKNYDCVEAVKRATLYDEVDRVERGRAPFDRATANGLSFAGEVPLELPPLAQVACTDLVQAGIDRRTSRDYTDKPITAEDLSLILHCGYRAYRSDLYPAAAATCRLEEPFLNIHAVQGVEPGAYYYDVAAHTLRQIKPGDFREQSKALTLDQECAGRSAACIFRFTHLKRVHDTYGARGYRYPLQEGGITGARIYAAARSIGIGTGAMGAFWDEECGPFFGLTDPHIRPLYSLTLGYEIEDTRIVETAG